MTTNNFMTNGAGSWSTTITRVERRTTIIQPSWWLCGVIVTFQELLIGTHRDAIAAKAVNISHPSGDHPWDSWVGLACCRKLIMSCPGMCGGTTPPKPGVEGPELEGPELGLAIVGMLSPPSAPIAASWLPSRVSGSAACWLPPYPSAFAFFSTGGWWQN